MRHTLRRYKIPTPIQLPARRVQVPVEVPAPFQRPYRYPVPVRTPMAFRVPVQVPVHVPQVQRVQAPVPQPVQVPTPVNVPRVQAPIIRDIPNPRGPYLLGDSCCCASGYSAPNLCDPSIG
jgi:hypothetical protein